MPGFPFDDDYADQIAKLAGFADFKSITSRVLEDYGVRGILRESQESLRAMSGLARTQDYLKEIEVEQFKRLAEPVLDLHRSGLESALAHVQSYERDLCERAVSITQSHAEDIRGQMERLTRETESQGFSELLKSVQSTLVVDREFSKVLASHLSSDSILEKVRKQAWQQHADTLNAFGRQGIVEQVLAQIRDRPAESLSSLTDIRHWIDNLDWDALADSLEPAALESSAEPNPSEAIQETPQQQRGWAALPFNWKFRLFMDVVTLLGILASVLFYVVPREIENKTEPAAESRSAEAPVFELWVLTRQESMRAKPHVKAASVVVLPDAALIRVLKERRGWLLIEAEAGEGALVRGWIPKKSACPLQEALMDYAIEQLQAHKQEAQGERESAHALALRQSTAPPALIETAGPATSQRFAEFFAASIRNPNTRAAYWRACTQFLDRCNEAGLALHEIQPVHVAGYVEHLGQSAAAPTVKQHLAAIRRMFDYLVIGQILPSNPSASVRGPKHVVSEGKTPILEAEEVRQLFGQFDVARLADLRDRAILGAMVYSFARVSAVARLRIKDYYRQGARAWFVLQEKGGKQNRVPAHHQAAEYVEQYLAKAGIEQQREMPLFRSLGRGRGGNEVTERGLRREEIFAMVRRRTAAVDLPPEIGCHSFRGTGITNYLKNGGTIETAAKLAGHASTRTTQLYDRRLAEVAQAEVERIRF